MEREEVLYAPTPSRLSEVCNSDRVRVLDIVPHRVPQHDPYASGNCYHSSQRTRGSCEWKGVFLGPKIASPGTICLLPGAKAQFLEDV
jgi:hypothetical protein